MPSSEEAEETIRRNLQTITVNPDIQTVEIAFYGGSFTAIPMEQQNVYLQIARKYREKGLIDRIRLSTRPDCIDERILDNLQERGVDIIELGVQSFDEEVLKKAARGHGPAAVFRSAELIKDYGFELGIQLMTGLPGDSYEKCMNSVEETVRIAPAAARIYPTVLIKETVLYDMYLEGRYDPPGLEESVVTVKDMYRRLSEAGINVIRIGLKSTDIIRTEDGAVAGGYHPAFRQLVESEIAKEDLEEQIRGVQEGEFIFSSNPVSFSNMTGHKKSNRTYFSEKYPGLRIRYETDDSLSPKIYKAVRIG